MATADDVASEIMGTNPPTNHHDVVIGENGPSPRKARTMQDKVSVAAREVTLWVKRRGVSELLSKKSNPDTTLGHAVDAASFGEKNYLILKKIADKLGVDITDIQ